MTTAHAALLFALALFGAQLVCGFANDALQAGGGGVDRAPAAPAITGAQRLALLAKNSLERAQQRKAAFDDAGGGPPETTPRPARAPGSPVIPHGTSWYVLHHHECAQSQRQWLFCDDFESDNNGAYYQSSLGSPHLRRVGGAGVGNSNAVESVWQAGKYHTGDLRVAFGKTPDNARFRPVDQGIYEYSHVNARFYVRYGVGWASSSETQRDAMLASMVLGGREMEQAAVVTMGLDAEGAPSLSARSGVNAATGKLQTLSYNDLEHLRDVGSAESVPRARSDVTDGQWHCVEMQWSLDDVGRSDGDVRLWIDEELVAHTVNASFVNAYNSYGVNMVVVTNVLAYAAPQEQRRFIDNFVISTMRVGCLGTHEHTAAAAVAAGGGGIGGGIGGADATHHLDLSNPESALQLLHECWQDDGNPLRMFVDEACHLAWRYELLSGGVSKVERAQALGVEMQMGSGYRAIYVPCAVHRGDAKGVRQVTDGKKGDGAAKVLDDVKLEAIGLNSTLRASTPTAAVLAYHIDRLMQLHRVPPVVARAIPLERFRTAGVQPAAYRALRSVAAACGVGSGAFAELEGTLCGWTRYELAPVTADELLRVPFGPILPRHVEITRYVVLLLLTHQPHKLLDADGEHALLSVPSTGGRAHRAMHLVSAENEQAVWSRFKPIMPPEKPCDRSVSLDRYKCSLGAFTATRAKPLGAGAAVSSRPERRQRFDAAMGALLSYLESACVFPERLVQRLRLFAEASARTEGGQAATSLYDALLQAAEQDLAVLGEKGAPAVMNGRVLDATVRAVYLAYLRCVKDWGRARVVVPETSDAEWAPDNAPRTHVDPAGRHYQRNSITGVWERVNERALQAASQPASPDVVELERAEEDLREKEEVQAEVEADAREHRHGKEAKKKAKAKADGGESAGDGKHAHRHGKKLTPEEEELRRVRKLVEEQRKANAKAVKTNAKEHHRVDENAVAHADKAVAAEKERLLAQLAVLDGKDAKAAKHKAKPTEAPKPNTRRLGFAAIVDASGSEWPELDASRGRGGGWK